MDVLTVFKTRRSAVAETARCFVSLCGKRNAWLVFVLSDVKFEVSFLYDTDISAIVLSIVVKFCMMVHICPGSCFSDFGGLNFDHLTVNISKTVSRSVTLPLPTFSLLLVVTSHLVLEIFARQLLLFGIVCLLTSVLAKLSQHSADTSNLIFSIQPSFSIQPLPLPSDPSQRL